MRPLPRLPPRKRWNWQPSNLLSRDAFDPNPISLESCVLAGGEEPGHEFPLSPAPPLRSLPLKEFEASTTARFVAMGVFHTATHLCLNVEVPSRMAELNERMLQASTRSDLHGTFGRRWVRWRAGLFQRWAVPGIFLHFVLRKRWIEALAREAIDRGAIQVVILGAGLDTLSLRLAETNPEL